MPVIKFNESEKVIIKDYELINKVKYDIFHSKDNDDNIIYEVFVNGESEAEMLTDFRNNRRLSRKAGFK